MFSLINLLYKPNNKILIFKLELSFWKIPIDRLLKIKIKNKKKLNNKKKLKLEINKI